MTDRAVVRAGTGVGAAMGVALLLFWLTLIATCPLGEGKIFLLATSLIWIYAIAESIGRLRTCWIADSESIRMERNNKLCWECPWEDFAGYWIKSVPWYRFSARNQYVVLDRKGVERGVFVLPDYRYRDSAFFRRTLEHNTPKEFLPKFKPPKLKRKGKPLKTIAFGVSAWLIGCLLLTIWPDERRDIQNTIIGSLPTISVSLLLLSLYDWMRIRGPGASDRSSTRPVYGPSFHEWRLEHDADFQPLVEGKTYGYVDCHNRARFAEEDAKFFEEGRYFFLLLLLLGFLSFPRQIGFELTMFWIFAVIWLLSGVAAITIRRSARHLQDRIRLDGTTLIVNNNREERRYDWSQPKTFGLRRLDGIFGLRQKANGYALDPRYLIEMPSEADIAEILETHQRIEAMV